jgi:hypothetical protein
MATIEFGANRYEIRPGECATLHWRVDGVKAVYVFAEGQRWREHGVVGEGQREVCPQQTTTYRLRTILPDDSTEKREIVVRVGPAAGPPVIREFRADRGEIRRGECVTFHWHVEGVKEVYFHREDKPWHKRGVVGIGQAERCPSGTSTFCLRVVKLDGSVETRSITVRVKG